MRRPLAFLLFAGALLGVACGGGSSTSASGDVKRYCEVTRSIFRGQHEPPSDEEMDKWEAAAPPDIATDVKTVAAAYREINNTPEPDFEKMEQESPVGVFDRIESFDEKHCGIKPVEGE